LHGLGVLVVGMRPHWRSAERASASTTPQGLVAQVGNRGETLPALGCGGKSHHGAL